MKYNIIKCLIVTLLGAIVWASCSNEFDLIDAYKDIPVVYGVLSPQDTAHYIRVERAFIDAKTSALVLAQRPDSLYYKDATVQIQNVASGQIFTLLKVDGNLEGYVRDTGIFAAAPNFLYKIKSSELMLQGGKKYKLIIKRAGSDKNLVEATTEVADSIKITAPNQFESSRWIYDNLFSFTWGFSNQNTNLFDVSIAINYDEYDASTPAMLVAKTQVLDIAKRLTPADLNASTFTYREMGIDLYKLLGNAIAAAPNKRRIFRTYDVIVKGGGKELLQYISVGKANSGLTGSELPPTFTNINGGYGIFSSVSTKIKKGYTIHPLTRDSIVNGIYTKQLNFQ